MERFLMFYTPHGYSFLMEDYKPMKRRLFKLIRVSVCEEKLHDYQLQCG